MLNLVQPILHSQILGPLDLLTAHIEGYYLLLGMTSLHSER